MNEKFYDTTGLNTDNCVCRSVNNYGVSDKSRRISMLRKIQEYNFMMIETGLFLNNQPYCEAAQEAFSKYREEYLEALKEYESCYGPLTFCGADVKRDGWKWVNTPWPWELEEC